MSSGDDSSYRAFGRRQLRKTCCSELKSAGCHIGLHSSEIAYNNREQLDREISRLKQSAGLDDIDGNRNHMLLYDVNQLEYLAGQDIFLDSTFGFHFRNGFRCGICQKYPMFNYLSRHVMEVYQLPFSIKDNGSFYLNKTAESMRSDILSTISTVKRYRGDVVFLWHTNKLNSFEKMNYKKSLSSQKNSVYWYAKERLHHHDNALQY